MGKKNQDKKKKTKSQEAKDINTEVKKRTNTTDYDKNIEK